MQAPVSVIYLVHESPHGSSVLPSTVAEAVGRATLRRWYTRTCSLQQAQPNDHPLAGGLLHHLLTLTCSIRSTGGYFLLPSPTVTNSFHFQKWSALCCPDFPLVPKTPATDRGSAFGCKITKSRAQNKEKKSNKDKMAQNNVNARDRNMAYYFILITFVFIYQQL